MTTYFIHIKHACADSPEILGSEIFSLLSYVYDFGIKLNRRVGWYSVNLISTEVLKESVKSHPDADTDAS